MKYTEYKTLNHKAVIARLKIMAINFTNQHNFSSLVSVSKFLFDCSKYSPLYHRLGLHVPPPELNLAFYSKSDTECFVVNYDLSSGKVRSKLTLKYKINTHYNDYYDVMYDEKTLSNVSYCDTIEEALFDNSQFMSLSDFTKENSFILNTISIYAERFFCLKNNVHYLLPINDFFYKQIEIIKDKRSIYSRIENPRLAEENIGILLDSKHTYLHSKKVNYISKVTFLISLNPTCLTIESSDFIKEEIWD